MLDVFSVTFPFFALVLAGFIATRRKLLPIDAIAGLNIFVLYFALPCMLLRFGARTQLAQLLNPAVFFTYFIVANLMVSLALYIAFTQSRGWNNASFGALVAAFPNTGFMGVPLLYALFGQDASGTAIVTITVDMIYTTSLCIALSRLEGADVHGFRVAMFSALKGVALNPMPWAIGLGVVFCALQVQLPVFLDRSVQLLSDAASPTALFTLGAVLARSELNRTQSTYSGLATKDVNFVQSKSSSTQIRPDFWVVSVLKLFVHPTLMYILGKITISLGFDLNAETLKIMILIAALPSASNVVMLAQRYEADNERIAKIIFFTTAVAFFSFSFLVSAYAAQ